MFPRILGCATGEEPYSIAILLRECLEQDPSPWHCYIFATDLDANLLAKAEAGEYYAFALNNVKYGIVQKYFQRAGDLFRVAPEIRNMVAFSVYDLLEAQTSVPPESIFGDFDLVFCRNVLIYFDREVQIGLFKKLFQALAAHGILVLGEAESLPDHYRSRLHQVERFCKVYEKR